MYDKNPSYLIMVSFILVSVGACKSCLILNRVFPIVILTLHVLAKAKRKRCFDVQPSIKIIFCACFRQKNA
jgi:hypothetical protein